MRYPVAAPDLAGNEAAYVMECLHSTWISSQGKFLDEFEARLAAFTETRHAVVTCNGTVALHLALASLGVSAGDEVIVPSLTFIATANAVRYCGAEPVFADSDTRTGCISPASVERLITPRTRAVVPVHLWGHPCEMDAIRQIADEHGLWMVEDAAEAIGARYRGQSVGSLGDAGVFSFFGNKIVTTGEGGAVTTNDDALAERLRLLRGQGMTPSRRYWHETLGFNYRMSNLAAAIGVAQMERIDSLLDRRRMVARWYRDALASCDLFSLPIEAADVHHAWWMVSVLLPEWADRDALMTRMADRGIETRPFFYPAHEMPMYQDSVSDGCCPIASEMSRRGICLPTSSGLSQRDVAFIAATLVEAAQSQCPAMFREAA